MKKQLKIEASLYTILQVLSATAFELTPLCRHLRVIVMTTGRAGGLLKNFN
jgi:hypothetical protein